MSGWISTTGCSCGHTSSLSANAGRGNAYATLPEIRRVIDRALAKYRVNKLRVGLRFTPGSKRRVGYCDWHRKTKVAVVCFGKSHWQHMAPRDRLDVIFHETAHAIDFMRGGSGDHGPKWRAIAKRLGGSGEQVFSDERYWRTHVRKLKQGKHEPWQLKMGMTQAKASVGMRVRFALLGRVFQGTIVHLSARVASVKVTNGRTVGIPYIYLHKAESAPRSRSRASRPRQRAAARRRPTRRREPVRRRQLKHNPGAGTVLAVVGVGALVSMALGLRKLS